MNRIYVAGGVVGLMFAILFGAVSLRAQDAPATQPAGAMESALASYTVINRTDVGQSLVREVPNVKTTAGALRMTFPDLEKFFGAKPTLLGGYEDQKDHRSAFVSFSAQINGEAMKGFVTTKLRDQGAVVFVVFGKQKCTPAEWAKLTARPPGGERDLKSEMARVPLRPYQFPDNTGAIGLAEGWTTNAQTESNLSVKGPAGQTIRMAFGGTLYLPEANIVRQNPQNVAKLNLTVAPFDKDPVAALANVIRANSVVSQRRGGPTIAPDKVIKVVQVPPKNGGRAAQVTYDFTLTDRSGTRHLRAIIQYEVTPPNNGAWGYYCWYQAFGPKESFEQDLPVMLAQVFSMSENAAAVMAKSRREMDAAKKLADAQHAAADKVAQAHYDQTKSVEENEQIKMRSLTDFDEVIRGERTVEDTRTGEQTSVNLADVHNIVDALNHDDPDRYKEIPLRDQFYPLPGHENDPDYVGR